MSLGATELYERLMRRVLMALGARAHRLRYRGGELHSLSMEGKGELPPLVLLHGYSASGASQYWAMSRHLRPHASRVVLPDLPGHGLSSVPATLDSEVMLEALRTALDRLVDRPCVVFASSMAGALGVRLAGERPDAVAGLMLCSPAGAPLSPVELAHLQRSFAVRNHNEALAFVDRLFAERHPLRHVYAWGVRQQFNRPHLVDMLRRIADHHFLRPDELRSLRVPVYLLWGAADRILPQAHIDFFRKHLPPGSEIDIPPRFGHAPFLHRSDEVAERLLRFGRRVAARVHHFVEEHIPPSGRQSTPSAEPQDDERRVG